MIPFTAPLEDIMFSLEHVAGADQLPGYDTELYSEIGAHFAAFAEGVLAPLNQIGDEQGAQLIDGRVQMPDGFGDAYAQFCEQGWPGLTAPEDYGGQELGGIAFAIVSEIFAGANHSMEMVCGTVPGAIRCIVAHGTDQQKEEFLPPLTSGEWLATMALTEPGAGSDLGRIKCKATRDGNDWVLSGEKIFISGGDQDMSDSILHLVLARSSGGGLGGLSLFLCRSDLADGTRNAVQVARIEEKMGLHASPTCQMVFDNARAELIGVEGQGLAAMFSMMNHMRISVSLQGPAHAARATAIARAYAADRIQGKDTPIAQHPDVARMLDEMDLRTVGARGIAHLALALLEGGQDAELVELLTPIAKYFSSETASEAADMGIQVLGGYGFLEEYGLSQVLRDARICRIYEGTSGIHALSLATRMVRLNEPLAALDRFASGCADVAEYLDQWRAAWNDLKAMKDTRPVADAFMRLTAELVHQIVWSRIAANADAHPDPERMRRLAQRARARFAVAFAQFGAEKSLVG